MYDEYFKVIKNELGRVKDEQRNNIIKTAHLVGDVMKDDGIVQLFGWGPNRTFSMELGYRAGGLIQYHQFTPKDALMRGLVSKAEYDSPDFSERAGLVDVYWNLYNIDSRDIFMLIEFSNPVKITNDIAVKAKNNGHKIVFFTNTNIPGITESKAYELADIIIDINVAYPDLAVNVDEERVCQLSGLIGNVVAQMMTAEIYKYLTNQRINPGVLLSANLKGADIHNNALGSRFDGRYNS